MKVLLLEDFSSFHKYLKDGLCQCGVDVTLVSSGDGWKKIGGANYPLYDKQIESKNKILRILQIYKASIRIQDKLGEYDVIQIINPRIYSPFVNFFLVSKILKKGRLKSLVCCGNDLALYKSYCNGQFDYSMYDGDNELKNEYRLNNLRGAFTRVTEPFIVRKVDLIIPTSYEYWVGYKNDVRQTKVIPMPINVDSIEYKENIIDGKIVFYHGIIRAGQKGTDIILKALNRLQEKYSDQVEIIVSNKMPFDQYVKTMDKANVVIDQCRSYAYGINADIAMAQGKVVLSGARKEALESLGVSKCPIFGIIPDENQIYQQLEFIVMNRDKITLWGKESREYVEKVHDCKKVAKEYIKVWSKGLNE